ncbi:MAG: hypothetical protein IPN52_15230 [Micrococcales bacterium]|nr:hypothetical protein [Micrococcales bacterium]
MAKNAGQDDAADTTLAVNLPGSAAITSVSSSQGSCSTTGLSVNCAFGTLDREGEVTVLVVARAPGSGTMTSTATVTAPIIDPNSANNSATATATVPGVSSPPPPPSPAPIAAACSNSIPGDNKGNKLRGTSAGDRIRGVGGNDVLRGLGGDDCLNGGRGNDRLIAGPGSDRLTGGKGRDTMLGAGGPDMIKARDGQRDVIKCGPGARTRSWRTDPTVSPRTASRCDASSWGAVPQRSGPHPPVAGWAGVRIAPYPAAVGVGYIRWTTAHRLDNHGPCNSTACTVPFSNACTYVQRLRGKEASTRPDPALRRGTQRMYRPRPVGCHHVHADEGRVVCERPRDGGAPGPVVGGDAQPATARDRTQNRGPWEDFGDRGRHILQGLIAVLRWPPAEVLDKDRL